MKVLYITNMYPDTDRPYYGIFIKEQIEAIRKQVGNFNYSISVIHGYRGYWEYLKSIAVINYKIFKYRPDVIHVHYGLSGLFLLANPFVGNRIMVTLHGGDIQPAQRKKIQNILTAWVIRRSNIVVVLNEHMREIVSHLGAKIYTIKCGVNLEFFSCKREKRSTRKAVVVFPSNINRPEKNYALFCSVIKKLSKEYNRKMVTKVIDGMTRNEVKDILCSSHCLLMTSISEGSPQIVKEAMACNLPIVTVDVGDVKELMKGVENCYISNEYSAAELAVLVQRVLNGVQKTNGRQALIRRSLDNKVIARKIYRLYERIAKGKCN